jgi:hypothetical protein
MEGGGEIGDETVQTFKEHLPDPAPSRSIAVLRTESSPWPQNSNVVSRSTWRGYPMNQSEYETRGRGADRSTEKVV